MPVTVSKTDYILWRECPKNAWLKIHKPELYYASELTEFEQSIIDNGIEVEEVARALFPDGVLIKGRDEEANRLTQELVAAKTPTLFQPIFVKDGFLDASDVLQFRAETGGYAIYEIKSSTKPKDDHLYDVAFQALLLRGCGLKIDQIFVMHLNSSYVRSGDLDLANLFSTADMTLKVQEVAELVAREMEAARTYLLSEAEHPGHCCCVYKGRSRHCSTFRYSNPEVPEYGVHDISRIGNSKKKLAEMVDAGIFELDKIPIHIELTAIQQGQVRAYNSGETELQKTAVAAEFAGLQFPIYFIDYETYPGAIPLFDGYGPYNHVPAQYSLHIVDAPGAKVVHKEFLYKGIGNPDPPFVASLREHIGPRGSIIVWSKAFECSINKAIAARFPECEQFMTDFNERVYDLMDVFSKQYYVHKNLWGKVSVKNVLPVLVPDLSYKELDIRNGGMASICWGKIISGKLSKEESDELREALRRYCGLDSYAMCAIWQALCKMISA